MKPLNCPLPEGPRAATGLLPLVLLVAVGLLLAGCEQAKELASGIQQQVQDMTGGQEQDQAQPTPAEQPPAGVAEPSEPAATEPQPTPPQAQPAEKPSEPEPKEPQPTPEQIIAEFLSKTSSEITNEDLQKVAALDEGLEKITTLSLRGSRVNDDGLAFLEKFTALIELDLGAMRFTQAGLESVGKIPHLETLYLDSNSHLDDADLEPVGQMTGLKKLSLRKTGIRDAGLVHLKGLVNLEHLDIGETLVTGASFDQLRALPLKTLIADHTRFGMAGFNYVKSCRTLEELNVEAAYVRDEALVAVRRAAKLRVLNLAANVNVTDRGLTLLKGMRTLEILILHHCSITDRGLANLVGCRQLRLLDVYETNCTPAGAAALKKRIKELKIKPFDEV